MAASARQIWFAWSFGVVAPIAVAVLDPVVFKGPGILQAWAPLGYTAIVAGTGLLAYCLYVRPDSNLQAGALFGFAVIAAGIGLFILPFSVIGLFIGGLGALGLTPFLTAWAFVWAGKRCIQPVATEGDMNRRVSIVWGLALSILGVIAVQIGVSRLIDATLRDIERGDHSVTQIQVLNLFGIETQMCRHRNHVTEEGRAHFAAAYREAFGTSMDESCAVLLD